MKPYSYIVIIYIYIYIHPLITSMVMFKYNIVMIKYTFNKLIDNKYILELNIPKYYFNRLFKFKTLAF